MGLYAWFTGWWIRPSRLTVRRWEQTAREGEEFIADYEFPAYLQRRVERHEPQLSERWELVEQGLREWFVCCAWRGGTMLGMPSRAVDEAWHEFILDSIPYTRFCNFAFGAYLHHTPDEGMSTPVSEALRDTVRAWDRSDASEAGDSVLWDLDRQLGIRNPLGIDVLDLGAARTGPPVSAASALSGGGTPWVTGAGFGCGTGIGDGGDGGGGCGGGCGGGGS
jgi:hypothetical protein